MPLGTQLYDGAVGVGKFQFYMSIIVLILIAAGLFIWSYYLYKGWNNNIIDIVGTVSKVNNSNGKCDVSVITQSNNQTTTNYICSLTVNYNKPNASRNASINASSNVSTNSTTNYEVGQNINLYYDTSSTVLTPSYFRFQPWWILTAGFITLLAALINYIIVSNKRLKPLVAAYGANAIGRALF